MAEVLPPVFGADVAFSRVAPYDDHHRVVRTLIATIAACFIGAVASAALSLPV
jgi:ABC-type phosphate/phosphonate transport system permease subunit